MTRESVDAVGTGNFFSDINELRRANETGQAHLHARIKVRVPETDDNGEETGNHVVLDTTVGRALLSEILPKKLSFELIDRPMKKKTISELINVCYRIAGLKASVIFADQLMYTGFRMAALAGISIGVDDMVIPGSKDAMLDVAQKEVVEIQSQYTNGLLTDGERYNKVIDIWTRTSEQVADAMMSELGTEKATDKEGAVVDQESF